MNKPECIKHVIYLYLAMNVLSWNIAKIINIYYIHVYKPKIYNILYVYIAIYSYIIYYVDGDSWSQEY